MDKYIKLTLIIAKTFSKYISKTTDEKAVELVKNIQERMINLNIEENEYGYSFYRLIPEAIPDLTLSYTLPKQFDFDKEIRVVITNGEYKGKTLTLEGRLYDNLVYTMNGLVIDFSDVEFVMAK